MCSEFGCKAADMLGALGERAVAVGKEGWRSLRASAGQTLAEYGLLLGGVATAILLSALLLFGDAIASAFSGSSDCVQGNCATNPGVGDPHDDEHHD